MSRKIVDPKTGKVRQIRSESATSVLPKEPDHIPSEFVPETPMGPAPVPEELRPDRSNQPRSGEAFGTEFLDNVAHQMVAPLQSIEMHCQGILDGEVPEDKHQMRLKEVVGHAKILAELARRMRFLHELVEGKKLDTETLGFSSVVTGWIDGFNNYLPIARQMLMDIKMDTEVMNALPDVVASRLAMHQIVMNLYDNAIKYGEPGTKIRIKAKKSGQYVENEFSHRAHVVLTEAACAQMFQRGFRATEAKRARASGTGIGMWISKQLMQAMQGDLVAIPTNGGVTRFRLFWRIVK